MLSPHFVNLRGMPKGAREGLLDGAELGEKSLSPVFLVSMISRSKDELIERLLLSNPCAHLA